MDQQQQQDVHEMIANLRQQLIQLVGTQAKGMGFSNDEIQVLMNLVQPKFFTAWFEGVDAPEALDRAIKEADLEISVVIVEKMLMDGSEPIQAFSRIKNMKIKAGAEADIADQAEVAFLASLDSGGSVADAMAQAYSRAA